MPGTSPQLRLQQCRKCIRRVHLSADRAFSYGFCPHRELIGKIFTPSLVRGFEPRILEIVNDPIDRFAVSRQVDF